ncbi:hypothetical protein VHA01S_080_00160 [Vibrio halioticoli NBRC 102217]|uniref:Uncharacterized protein n=1 Tax=Vibrio halioticoli NBRC 102217 TaxID=1219072 RepID=V5FNX0_9VIBR|nr:hypothetical protein [Vibrio halioticoli]GAD91276.1 hypothetical protein VHA01S_080_00160 [Vibrio halioticoli NBRC 102217]
MKFKTVKEGDFFRLTESGGITDLIVQESTSHINEFNVVGINSEKQVAYAIRHTRIDELRSWKRLDRLAQQLKKRGVAKFQVQFIQKEQ